MCSENMLQIYWKTAMPKCDFNKCHFNFIEIALRHGCSPVNLLHNFRTPFLKNTSGRLPLTKWWVLLSCIISAVVQEIKFIFQDYCNGILFSCSLFWHLLFYDTSLQPKLLLDQLSPEAYSEICPTSKMEPFAKILILLNAPS